MKIVSQRSEILSDPTKREAAESADITFNIHNIRLQFSAIEKDLVNWTNTCLGSSQLHFMWFTGFILNESLDLWVQYLHCTCDVKRSERNVLAVH